MDVRACKPGLTPLFLAVPPMFERLVGYRGSSRFVAFSWGSCDELVFLDEMLASGTLNSAGWKIFIAHTSVRKHLTSFQLGCSGVAARHWLLLDRKLRRFFVGERDAVETFLEAGTGSEVSAQDMPATTMSLDEFIALAGNPARHPGEELSTEEMMRRLQDQQAVCVELREWLDRLG